MSTSLLLDSSGDYVKQGWRRLSNTASGALGIQQKPKASPAARRFLCAPVCGPNTLQTWRDELEEGLDDMCPSLSYQVPASLGFQGLAASDAGPKPRTSFPACHFAARRSG
jgi:hypothetical protein